ncbi:MAG: RNA polymerase sigma-70 factor, ECF subfamily [Candidatus Jorgensenbacteria bacterium GW2011_GWA1_48_13]|uniref:RNA polymerase sigma-70 factor, ECF subfamily n=2 Tax=Candidatus Joergenseniibacteriota TaxID=1752739 RepID=A0A0G1YK14_9BACT|nr:MAG: RNA polymerase sigma-70 factor, ECF subfamily [Candidatus Jorgensenbacteria bacterium GW2011_GWA1_48_13]KKU98818.1 MAG: RNA polymerase ECF-type sigma factor [Candidatus Jorgensenbacteria bacterium GW2011_GWC1_48_8]KKW15347.1 MAG: RNA polymerase sigma-70 factor, ECF subfamily [Candidatus Jorgensenbacteria bacterium GW2011_GWB1_50_10]
MTKEESELVKKAQKGDNGAFGEIYDRHLPAIYRFILLKVGTRVDAEDICHQVFLSAWQNIGNYREKGFPFSSWLYKIARNAVVDHWRTNKVNVNIELVSENLLSDLPDIGEKIDKKLELKLIWGALRLLDEDHQNLLIMKFVDELSNKEIAGILGKSEGAVRVIQHRALKQIKKILEQ